MPTSNAGAIEKLAVSSGGYAPGETATFDLRIKNEGSKPVENANVRVMLAKIEDGDGYAKSGQYAYLDRIPEYGETVVKLSYDVTRADVGNDDLRIVAMATVPVPGKTPLNITCESEPIPITGVFYRLAAKLEITNRGNGLNNAFTTGDTIQGTLTVTNESLSALTGIRVTMDPAVNISSEAFNLAEDANRQIPFTYKVTEDDILAQDLTFTATVSCTEASTTDTVEVELEEVRRGVSVVWIETSEPADGTAYDIYEYAKWNLVITNTGNTSLSNVVLQAGRRGEIKLNGIGGGVDAEWDWESREYPIYCIATLSDPIPAGKSVTLEYTVYLLYGSNVPSVTFSADNMGTLQYEAAPIIIEQPVYSLDLKMALTNSGTGTNGAFMLGETPEGTITLTNTGNRDLIDLEVVLFPTDTEVTSG